jgi:hypothetical protein
MLSSKQIEVPVVAAWTIANLHRKRQLVKLPSRQMVSRVKLQRNLLHDCLGNGYRTRGPPSRSRKYEPNYDIATPYRVKEMPTALAHIQAPDILSTSCGQVLFRLTDMREQSDQRCDWALIINAESSTALQRCMHASIIFVLINTIFDTEHTSVRD